MKTLKRTQKFKKWFEGLKDLRARAAITLKLTALVAGKSCDIKKIDASLFELRVFVGKGYRVYYTETHAQIIVLLCGGHKGTQSRDIEKAKQILSELE